jgi:hypothetical protein
MEGDEILSENPNLILIHAGTNDNWFEADGEPYLEAPFRFETLLDYVLCNAADAVVLVAKLIANKQNQTQTDFYNYALPGIVGYKIRIVDHTNVNGDLLIDLLHPNDQGYQLMAQNWMDAINDLPPDWISAPVGPAPSSSGFVGACTRDKFHWTVALNGNQVATGAAVPGDSGEPSSANGDGNTWAPDWDKRTTIASGAGPPGTGVEFADLDGLYKLIFVARSPTDKCR